jgi:hypothetical protein
VRVALLDRTHCRRCGRPFSEAGRYETRLLCRPCGLERERSKSRAVRLRDSQGLHARGERCQETAELKKICGRQRLLRERRIVRYARCVELGIPIQYEPADSS